MAQATTGRLKIDDRGHKPDVPSVSVVGLSKTFSLRGQRIEVLNNVSLDVQQGEFVTMLGPSGCGKSTMLRIIQGLETPSSGQVYMSGQSLAGPGPDRGCVFQRDTLYPWRTAMRNVTFGLELKGVSAKNAKARAQEMIDLVGLTGFENSYPSELSGGMRQRVNLARALAIDPDVLLMDEPFAALDALTRETMQQELLRITGASRKTVLFITHQIDEAVLLSDRVAVMSRRPGRIVEVIDVPLERPRVLSMKRLPAFQECVARIWNIVAAVSEDSSSHMHANTRG